jgi:thiamine biosynthesis lipoprotein
MGTTVSVAIRPPLVDDEVIDRFFDQLRAVDAQFSPYRADSEVSRLARGELSEADASPDLLHVLAACDHLALVTDGAFDARRHRPDGRPDPSGYVKGWAIEEAAWILDSAGARNYWVNAGGDIVARGEATPGRKWRVGIQHPDRRDRVAAALAVSDRAVATTGSYERGDHILDPRGRPGATAPSALRSVTVVGPTLAFTDALHGRGLTAPRCRTIALTSSTRPATQPAPTALAFGRWTTNRAPPSARLATSISPPWRSTIQAAIASPRPVPPPGAPCAR